MKKIFILCAAILVGLPGAAKAEGWFVGVESGYIKHRYTPSYVSLRGGSGGQFTNESDGIELGLLAGYEFALAEHFSIATQVRGAWNNSEWSLFISDEPARLRYKNPINLGFNVVPVYQITDKFGVYLDLGFVAGRINQEKRSPSADRSSFNYDDWVPGYSFGGGFRYLISERLECRFTYRHTIFDDFSYSGHLPSGRRVEAISDDPTSNSFLLALIYRF